MLGNVAVQLDLTRIQRTFQHQVNTILPQHPRAILPVIRLQSTIRNLLEPKPGAIERGSLLGIADPESQMIKTIKLANVGTRSFGLNHGD